MGRCWDLRRAVVLSYVVLVFGGCTVPTAVPRRHAEPDVEIEEVQSKEIAPAGSESLRADGNGRGACLSDVDTGLVLFTREWEEAFFGAGDGCVDRGRGSFFWRKHGFGSNINNLLNAWVYIVTVKKWRDMSVVMTSEQLGAVECEEPSGGQASSAWECLYSPMPHLLIFNSLESWEAFMRTKGVPETEVAEAMNLTQNDMRRHPERVSTELQGLNIEYQAVTALFTKHLWNHMQPWLRRDIDSVLNSPETMAVSRAPFVALHIRRGDKIEKERTRFIEAEDFLSAAVSYLQNQTHVAQAQDHRQTIAASVDGIQGIWVASDDPNAVGEVRAVAHNYFPNVLLENIVWVGNGVKDGPETPGVTYKTTVQRYPSFVYMFADLHQLAASEVFVGTFSSNIGRLVYLLRKNNGKDGDSSISLDTQGWWPGRRRQLRRLRRQQWRNRHMSEF